MRRAYKGLRSGTPNPVVCGRKFCCRCGRWRPAHDFDIQRGHKDGRRDRLRAWCRTCTRIYNREAEQRRSETQRELVREYQRIWREVRRRRNGTPPRTFGPRSKRLPSLEYILLDPAPLLAVVEDWIKRYNYENGNKLGWRLARQNGNGANLEIGIRELAERAGVPERQIYRLRTGEFERVRLDVADKLAVGCGIPLALIYPDFD